ncbi:MAG: hypothetical protein OEW21_16350 [Betaproteobacteria bacterium]|nr:hypothetical protein [Betaproteobacteria bacterium]
MFFNRQRSREIDEFAIALAQEFSNRCPAGQTVDGTFPAEKLGRVIDDVCNRAASFNRERRLWMYGKAKLGAAFKLRLKESGYPETFVDDVTRQILLTMSGK